jgi:hypothetical protein
MATAVEKSVPPLVAGDKLSRAEFLRRWEAHPEIKNAELIGGTVFMASPVSVDHGDMDGDVGGWLAYYRAHTPGTACGHNVTAFLLNDAAQADLHLRILAEYGGGSWVEDKYLHGIPELLAEICRSSASYDLHSKLDLYQAARVPEYVAILLDERQIRWHILVEGKYQQLAADADGLLRSKVFPGLWLDGQALLGGNMAVVLARLQDGLNSSEHQAFVVKLVQRKQHA